jgi:hypothetical protein
LNSAVGVLKSVLQIFVGMFAFDRLPINDKTILGIILSLIGGTMFSYFEYTNKQILTTMDNSSEQKKKLIFNGEETKINTEKYVFTESFFIGFSVEID